MTDIIEAPKTDFYLKLPSEADQPSVLDAFYRQDYTTEVNPESDRRTGVLVEFDATEKIFSNPSDERTEAYVTGRFG